jgi:hypothetical protein
MFRENDFEVPLKVESDEARQLRELAAAIRMGCLVRPLKCDGVLFEGQFAACALGAASAGLGLGTNDSDPYEPIVKRFPVLALKGETLLDQIWYWNDSADWSREAIADWLDAEAVKR